MVFLVFVLFYLVTDHAPFWVFAILAAAHLWDSWREGRHAALEAARWGYMLKTLRQGQK